MEYRLLGKTGLRVSEICLGTMQFLWGVNEERSFRLLDLFSESGGNFLDTADMYSQWVPGLKGGESETVIGNWMRARGNRDKIVLATKVRCRMWEGPDGEGLGRAHVLRACEDSLRRLQTDRIDLYQCHWPDPEVPIEETLEAMQVLVRQGKVRFLGCSNFFADDIDAAQAKGARLGTAFASVQPRYSVIRRGEFEREVLPAALRHSLAVLPYSPLGEGFLTGKYRRGKPLPESVRAERVRKNRMTEANFRVLNALETLGGARGKTIAQMALGWLLTHPWMTAPIIGATTPEQLSENLGAAGLRLTPEEMKVLDGLTGGL